MWPPRLSLSRLFSPQNGVAHDRAPPAGEGGATLPERVDANRVILREVAELFRRCLRLTSDSLLFLVGRVAVLTHMYPAHQNRFPNFIALQLRAQMVAEMAGLLFSSLAHAVGSLVHTLSSHRAKELARPLPAQGGGITEDPIAPWPEGDPHDLMLHPGVNNPLVNGGRAAQTKDPYPAHAAAERGDISTVSKLLTFASIDATNGAGDTLLHIGCAQGNVALVTTLLQKCPTMKQLNVAGKTAYQLLLQHPQEGMQRQFWRQLMDGKQTLGLSHFLASLSPEEQWQSYSFLYDPEDVRGTKRYEVKLNDAYATTPLHLAVTLGDVAGAHLYMDNHFYLTTENYAKKTPLQCACGVAHVGLVNTLLDKAPDVVARYPVINDALCALQNPRCNKQDVFSIVHRLIAAGASRLPHSQHPPPLDVLIKGFGKQPDVWRPLFALLYAIDLDVIPQGDSLHEVIFHIQRTLEQQDLPSRSRIELPLLRGERMGLLRILPAMTAEERVHSYGIMCSRYGASCHMRLDELYETGVDKLFFSLDPAAQMQLAPTVAQLIELNILSAEAADAEGRTLLHTFALQGNLSLMELLIAGGVNVNATTDNGDTPLLLVLKHSNPSPTTVQFLLAHGADRCISNAKGETATSCVFLTNEVSEKVLDMLFADRADLLINPIGISPLCYALRARTIARHYDWLERWCSIGQLLTREQIAEWPNFIEHTEDMKAYIGELEQFLHGWLAALPRNYPQHALLEVILLFGAHNLATACLREMQPQQFIASMAYLGKKYGDSIVTTWENIYWGIDSRHYHMGEPYMESLPTPKRTPERNFEMMGLEVAKQCTRLAALAAAPRSDHDPLPLDIPTFTIEEQQRVVTLIEMIRTRESVPGVDLLPTEARHKWYSSIYLQIFTVVEYYKLGETEGNEDAKLTLLKDLSSLAVTNPKLCITGWEGQLDAIIAALLLDRNKDPTISRPILRLSDYILENLRRKRIGIVQSKLLMSIGQHGEGNHHESQYFLRILQEPLGLGDCLRIFQGPGLGDEERKDPFETYHQYEIYSLQNSLERFRPLYTPSGLIDDLLATMRASKKRAQTHEYTSCPLDLNDTRIVEWFKEQIVPTWGHYRALMHEVDRIIAQGTPQELHALMAREKMAWRWTASTWLRTSEEQFAWFSGLIATLEQRVADLKDKQSMLAQEQGQLNRELSTLAQEPALEETRKTKTGAVIRLNGEIAKIKKAHNAQTSLLEAVRALHTRMESTEKSTVGKKVGQFLHIGPSLTVQRQKILTEAQKLLQEELQSPNCISGYITKRQEEDFWNNACVLDASGNYTRNAAAMLLFSIQAICKANP